MIQDNVKGRVASVVGRVCLLAALACSGCMSYTCSTVKCGQQPLSNGSVRFYVRSFTLAPAATVYPFGSYSENRANGNARAERIRAAFAQHSPDFFVEQEKGSVPIDVTVNVARKGSFAGDFLLSFLCGFTYGILPARTSNELDVSVTVKLSDGFEVKGSSLVVANDDRAEYNVMFYSPVQLILAPVSSKWNGVRGIGGDTYDWYPTRKLGDIVRAALARFDQRQLKEAVEKAALPQVDFSFVE